MNFCWKFKKIILKNKYLKQFIKFGKTYYKVVGNLLKNKENLLINKENSKKWEKQCKF